MRYPFHNSLTQYHGLLRNSTVWIFRKKGYMEQVETLLHEDWHMLAEFLWINANFSFEMPSYFGQTVFNKSR